jgi:protease-4
MKKVWKWFWGLAIMSAVSLVGLLVVAALFWLLLSEETPRLPTLGKAVGLVELEGVITDPGPVVKQLKEYREDRGIAAIVLRIDSPGGVVAPSQEIYEEVRKTRRDGKHVVCSMGAVAASGGLYVACAAESILADPGTITGSIGVIMEFPNTQELLKKIGVSMEVVKSAEHKDIGSFWRTMTDDERKLLQSTVDDVFDQFVDVVARERMLPHSEVLEIADGRILSGRQAKELKLVDRLGTYEDAISLAASLGGIKGTPKVVRPRKRRTTLFDVFQSTSGLLSPLSNGYPRIEYRWAPMPFAAQK